MSTVSSIGLQQGMNMMGPIGGPRGGKELTDAQKVSITDILSSYDSSNVTETTAKEIFQKFSDAGIQPGRGMKETIEAAGFDAENLRKLGMPAEFNVQGAGHHGRTRQHSAITDAQKTTVTEILSKYDSTNLSSTDVNSIVQAFRDAGIGPAKGLRETIDAAGFKSDQILNIPRSDSSEQNFWASQNATQSINLTSLQSLQTILNQYDLSNITSDQQTSLVQQLQSTSLFGSSGINLSA